MRPAKAPATQRTIDRAIYPIATPNSPDSRRPTDSRENVENVVNPPSRPVERNRSGRGFCGLSAGMQTEKRPMRNEPARLMQSVESGKMPL